MTGPIAEHAKKGTHLTFLTIQANRPLLLTLHWGKRKITKVKQRIHAKVESRVSCKRKTRAQMPFYGNQWTNPLAEIKCELSILPQIKKRTDNGSCC